MAESEESASLVRRAEKWTIGLGAAAALGAGIRWGWRAGAGVAAGALLSWINFRWLELGIRGLTTSAADAGATGAKVKRSVWVRFLGRYVLIVVGVCAILWGLHWPVIAVVAGLFAAVAGVLAALISHLLASLRQA